RRAWSCAWWLLVSVGPVSVGPVSVGRFGGHSGRRDETDCAQSIGRPRRRRPEPIAPWVPNVGGDPLPMSCGPMSLAIPPAQDLYATALASTNVPAGSRHWYARYEGGPRRSLGEALRRWCGTADPTDQDLLDRAPGAVLDAGCGP